MSCRGIALLAVVGLLVGCGPALAQTPDPFMSEFPRGILLVGLRDGAPDPAGRFDVVIRNIGGAPIVGRRVEVDFIGCTPDIRVCALQPGAEIIDCGDRGVRDFTDSDGKVTFVVVGAAGNPTGGAPGHPLHCVRIYVEGILMASADVAAFDQNGSGGVNPADIAVWLVDSFDATHFERSDFNLDGDVNPADLSLLLKVSLGGNSTASCSAYCH